MAFIPATNVAEVVLNGSWGGQNVANVIDFLYDIPLTISELNSLAATVASAWFDTIATVTSIAYVLTSVKATDLTTASSPGVEFFPTSDNVGQVGTASVPNNSTITISYSTDQRGRSYRGRSYMCGIPFAFQNTSVSVTLATAAGILEDWVDFYTNVETDRDCTHVVVSRRQNNVPLVTADVTEVTGYFVENNLDSQQRRLEGRGS